MKKIVFEFIFGITFSILGFFTLIAFHDLLLVIKVKHDWSGTGRLFWGLFLGLPFGCITGIRVVDRLFFKIADVNNLALLLAFLGSIFGNLMAIFLLEHFHIWGLWRFIIIAFINSISCVCGYRWGLSFK